MMPALRNIAIVGTGPTGLYTLHHLLQSKSPLSITLFEAGPLAGVGQPYSPEAAQVTMLANIASIEIPPLGETYLAWLCRQPRPILQMYGADPDRLHERQFLPRLLLGGWFRDRLEHMLAQSHALGHRVALREQALVIDVAQAEGDLRVTFEAPQGKETLLFSHVVLATGHDWPDDPDHDAGHFVSPWSGLIGADLPATSTGILGTSLSGIDAAMAVACQHGKFAEAPDGTLMFLFAEGAEALKITLMSRQGLLPEADFWCPIPYRPLRHLTEEALAAERAAGRDGLLDRLWARCVADIAAADPAYVESTGLAHLTPEGFAKVYFAPRLAMDPFDGAAANLAQVSRNTAARRVVEWRYAILRLHEPMESMVADLTEADRARFDVLKRVFIDNYAAVPPQSIQRLLALHRAGVLDILTLGADYSLTRTDGETHVITETGETAHFEVFIDARGQRSLGVADLPFPTLRAALGGDKRPVPISDSFAILGQGGRLFLPAAPYLLSRLPFVQGITASQDLGETVAAAILSEGTDLSSGR